MRPLLPTRSKPCSRRGITLVEMLVALGLLVLMMSVLVTVFQAATGSISTQRVYANIDRELRRLDTVIRQDLAGVTAKMTPPNDPKLGRGYFEYSENVFADAQGEDTDDTLRFTAQAPAGRPFVGRVWVPLITPTLGQGTASALRPITVTSNYAEIIYFLRNGNLYRRVLLILPQRQGTLGVGNYNVNGNTGLPQTLGFETDLFTPTTAFGPGQLLPNGLPMCGFMAMNDISVRARKFDGAVFAGLLTYTPTPNTLGDLTERHYRWCNPTWSNDYATETANGIGASPDGIPDDLNGDGVPDFVPTLYASNGTLNGGIFNEAPIAPRVVPPNMASAADVYAFPYVFPGSFSVPDSTSAALGWLHAGDRRPGEPCPAGPGR